MLPNRFIDSGYSSICFKLEVDEKTTEEGENREGDRIGR